MPALPPKLGKNPTPEEVENYREQLEEFQKVLAEKEKAQKVTAKEQEEREAENTRSQARLEKWKQQLTIDSEKLEEEREGFGAQRERLDIDLEKLKIDTKTQETQKKGWMLPTLPWKKIKNFRLTLDHHAREWYDTADCKGIWKDLKLGFSRYFSTQGRSVYNLHERWKMFKFNPQTDDIEEFVRNVQETAT